MEWWQFVGLVAAVVVPVGLAVHAAGRLRSDRNVERLDDAQERIARLEEKVDRHEKEIASLRSRWHDLRDLTMKEAYQLFEERMEAMKRTFEAWKIEILERVGRRRP